ncbi:unnamed protein product, partial [Symbiodinium sp. CCMP2456]
DCTEPVHSLPQTGKAFGTEASELTTVEHAFMLNTPRGWEAAGSCPPRECHLGFSFATAQSINCLVVQQGDDGFHAPALALQRRDGEEAAWSEVTAWSSIGEGRSKLAVGCPDPPAVPSASVSACRSDNLLFQECRVACKEGFGTLETSMRCVNGAWFVPQCWPLGSLLRVVLEEPVLLKPYWVVLDANLFTSDDCTGPIKMDGVAISSGEFVIKYANYHPKNAWDKDPSTSWASKGECEAAGTCWLGFRFYANPGPVRCVSLLHPPGVQYQARRISVQRLGRVGWEKAEPVTVRLLPEGKDEL